MRRAKVSRKRVQTFLLAAVTALSAAIRAEDSAPDIRVLMEPAEFEAAGLNALSPQQIDALNAWLLRYTAGDASSLRQFNDTVIREIEKSEELSIRSKIVGTFHGWTGKTVFRLENGQIWKQRNGSKWSYDERNPNIELTKNALGFWEMKVLSAGRSVGVRRIQ